MDWFIIFVVTNQFHHRVANNTFHLVVKLFCHAAQPLPSREQTSGSSSQPQSPSIPTTEYSVTRFSKKLSWEAPFRTQSNQGSGLSLTLNLGFKPSWSNRRSAM